jgi:hypothetical protein
MLDIAPSILMVDNQAAVQMGMHDKQTKLTQHKRRSQSRTRQTLLDLQGLSTYVLEGMFNH